MVTLELVTNNNCNLSCYYCFACNKKGNLHLSEEQVKDSLKNIIKISDCKKDNRIFIKIYGGEPLLFPKLISYTIKETKKLIEKYKNKKIRIGIISNGTIFNEELFRLIKENSFVHITFSLEFSELAHNTIRFLNNKKKTFDLFLENVSKINNISKKRISVQTVLSPDLLSNTQEYINFMEKYKDLFIFELVPMFDYTFEGKENLIPNMKYIFDYYIKSFKEKNCEHIGLFQVFRSIFNSLQLPYVILSNCNAGSGQLTVTPDNNLTSCSLIFHNKIDFKYKDIKEYLKLYELHEEKMKFSNECKICMEQNKIGCLGQCYVHKLKNEEKNIKHVCEYNIEFGKQSQRLLKELKGNKLLIAKADKHNSRDYEFIHKEFMRCFYE